MRVDLGAFRKDDLAMSENATKNFMERMWEAGQQHLVGGRYVAACAALESAEAIAWRKKDARSLARIYLPLLEARRQIRFNAADGLLLIAPQLTPSTLKQFLTTEAGTLLLRGDQWNSAHAILKKIHYEVRRTGRWLEVLLVRDNASAFRLTSSADPSYAAGISLQFGPQPAATPRLSTDPLLCIHLPPPGIYTTGALHDMARESLLVGWEALALRWQHRHPPAAPVSPWSELSWLRDALRVDPACEPITMRLIALAESLERTATR
jgi:hypothetical protein